MSEHRLRGPEERLLIGLVVAGVTVTGLSVVVLTAVGVASWLFEGGWVWPVHGEMGRTIARLTVHTGHPALAYPWLRPGQVAGAGAVWTITVLLLMIVLAIVAGFIVLWRRTMRDLHGGRTAAHGLTELSDPARVAAKAVAIQPRLAEAGRRLRLANSAVYLGRYGPASTALWGQQEHSVLLLASARGGKGRYFVNRWIIDAPGSVVATSTKVETIDSTWKARAKLGRVGVFDPAGMYLGSDVPTVRWNPVLDCEDDAEAIARAKAFVQGRGADEGTTNSEFFTGTATTVLQCLLHAAALSGQGIDAVQRWASNFNDPEPHTILESYDNAAAGWAADLAAQTGGPAATTSDSTRKTLKNILSVFSDKKVVWAATPTRAEQFDIAGFVRSASPHTLYILSDPTGKAGSTGALTTAFVTTLLAEAKAASQERAPQVTGRRLDPTLRLVLDEFCNIAAIPDLDEVLADSGGRGIHLFLIAQSKDRMRKVYGRAGADSLFTGANVHLLLGGMKDVETLEEFSRLIGDHDVENTSASIDSTGRRSTNSGTRRERIMPVEELLTLPMGQAIMLYANLPWAQLALDELRIPSPNSAVTVREKWILRLDDEQRPIPAGGLRWRR